MEPRFANTFLSIRSCPPVRPNESAVSTASQESPADVLGQYFPMLSRATVYNTLNLFVAKGLVRQHVLAEGGEESAAERTAIGRGLAVGGGPDRVPARRAEIVLAHRSSSAQVSGRSGLGCQSP